MIQYTRNAANRSLAKVKNEKTGEKFVISYMNEKLEGSNDPTFGFPSIPYYKVIVGVDKGYLRNIFSPQDIIELIEHSAEAAEKCVKMYAEICEKCSSKELKDAYETALSGRGVEHSSFPPISGTVFLTELPSHILGKLDDR